MSKKASSLVDTLVVYCGDNLEQLAKLPAACVDLIYIDPRFNSNRNYEVFWGETETKEKQAFGGRHGSSQAYFTRARCLELACVLTPCLGVIVFHREQSNSEDGTLTHVDASFTSAHPGGVGDWVRSTS